MTTEARNLERLHVSTKTLECARNKCVPCGYKIVVHARDADAMLNQRPELCPRFKAAIDTSPVFPLLEPQMKVLVVHDGGFALTSLLKGYLNETHQLVVATAETKAQVVKKSPDMAKRIKKLENQGVRVHFEADTGALGALGQFDRVIWNFVESGTSLDSFFASVSAALSSDGQVHMTTKTPAVVAAATAHGLAHVRSLVFDRSFCPSYKVPYSDCDTVVFSRCETSPAAASLPMEPVTDAILSEIQSTCLAKSSHDAPKPTKAAMKKAKLAAIKKKEDKAKVDVPYEKEYFDLMNLKPKGKKHVIKRKKEYEANQEGKERPSKRVLPHRMENGKRKMGW
ncbi:hypothetical protein DYB30_000020 [Aphanomyces astaci]|uniref:25S rRNA (uridine-N(3))-methyltransferase BMT5-like domain-containing protein n=1 Tax=Aphanomyces astaci TaxID=112090 RepID=A0A397AYW9_APHAT|nr:hypothetical protein DYB36_000542 [Aphanomyces astaci]RHY74590.1 hypothetical protein DYB30_000020 [Aphanomyces astaci]RHY79102.1 hypothetical protein DYB31_006150 [Aphanomyces astaci]RHZ33701.1 hypothetical protein DYB26_007654 [Aphanomyces astaci]